MHCTTHKLTDRFFYLFAVAHKRKSRDEFLRKTPVVAVVGDIHGKEYLQTTKQFTNDRIRSFISLIKDHPNLIRMFTSGQR